MLARGCSHRGALQCLLLHSGAPLGPQPCPSICRRELSPLTSLQPCWAWAPPPPCARASSPLVSPSSLPRGSCAQCGEQGGGMRPPFPAWVSFPIPTCPPTAPGMRLCSASLLCSHCQWNSAVGSAQACVASPVGQHLLLDQMRWFRTGDKLLGTRVLLSAQKQLFSSAMLLAS